MSKPCESSSADSVELTSRELGIGMVPTSSPGPSRLNEGGLPEGGDEGLADEVGGVVGELEEVRVGRLFPIFRICRV